jgi:hypothetical protein
MTNQIQEISIDDLDQVSGGKSTAYIQACPIGNLLVHKVDGNVTVVYYPPGSSAAPSQR